MPSDELAVRVVMSLPGAISYTAPELVNSRLRAVTVDGKRVGDPGHPLHE